MYITELFDRAPAGYHDDKEDKSTIKLDSSRQTRVTFAHLHQLRIGHDVRKLEHEKKLKQTEKQYAPAADASAGGLGI